MGKQLYTVRPSEKSAKTTQVIPSCLGRIILELGLSLAKWLLHLFSFLSIFKETRISWFQKQEAPQSLMDMTQTGLGDTALRSRAVSELMRHEGAARGSRQLRHSDASKSCISDYLMAECTVKWRPLWCSRLFPERRVKSRLYHACMMKAILYNDAIR